MAKPAPTTRTITCRLPVDLYDRLLEAAESDSPASTLTRESIGRLQQSFDAGQRLVEMQARYDAAIADMQQKYDNAADGWIQAVREVQAQNKDFAKRINEL